DDAFSAGMISAEDLAECVPQYRTIYETVTSQFPAASPREQFHESLRHLIDALVSGLIEGTVARAIEAGAVDSDGVRAFPSRLAAFTPDMVETSRGLKKFLTARL